MIFFWSRQLPGGSCGSNREPVIRAGLVDVAQAFRPVSGSHPFTLVLAVIRGSSELLPDEAAPEMEPRAVTRGPRLFGVSQVDLKFVARQGRLTDQPVTVNPQLYVEGRLFSVEAEHSSPLAILRLKLKQPLPVEFRRCCGQDWEQKHPKYKNPNHSGGDLVMADGLADQDGAIVAFRPPGPRARA